MTDKQVEEVCAIMASTFKEIEKKCLKAPYCKGILEWADLLDQIEAEIENARGKLLSYQKRKWWKLF